MRPTPASRDVIVISLAAIRRLLLVLVGIGAIVATLYFGRGLLTRTPTGADQIDRTAYPVVFINTGQAFYGRLTIADAETYLLTDAFYLTNDDSGQPTRLVRRGAEVFGPREPMVIQARQVLFFENLRDDSDLVKGIRAIKSGQVPGATAAPPTAAATPTARPSATR